MGHLEAGLQVAHGDEAELARRDCVAAARDDDRAEAAERRRAPGPVGERQQRVAGATRAVTGERPLVRDRLALRAEQLFRFTRAGNGFGRSRGRCGVVRGMPITIASSRSSRVAERASTARSSASACATAGGPAKAAVALRSRRTEWITRLRTAPGSRPKPRTSGERAMRSIASGSYG